MASDWPLHGFTYLAFPHVFTVKTEEVHYRASNGIKLPIQVTQEFWRRTEFCFQNHRNLWRRESFLRKVRRHKFTHRLRHSTFGFGDNMFGIWINFSAAQRPSPPPKCRDFVKNSVGVSPSSCRTEWFNIPLAMRRLKRESPLRIPPELRM